jgi:hypothetical protein
MRHQNPPPRHGASATIPTHARNDDHALAAAPTARSSTNAVETSRMNMPPRNSARRANHPRRRGTATLALVPQPIRLSIAACSTR